MIAENKEAKISEQNNSHPWSKSQKTAMEVGSLRFLKNVDYYIDGNRLNKTKTSVSLSLTLNIGSGCFAGVIRQEKKKKKKKKKK